MKLPIKLFLIFAVFALGMANHSCAAEFDLQLVAIRIAQYNPKLVVGVELAGKLSEELPSQLMNYTNLTELGRLVAANTDYEMDLDVDSVIIRPKASALHAVPLSNRMAVLARTEAPATLNDLVGRISGVDDEVTVRCGPFNDTRRLEAALSKVDLPEDLGPEKLSRILSSLTRKASLNMWMLSRGTHIVNGKEQPLVLSSADAEFRFIEDGRSSSKARPLNQNHTWRFKGRK